MFVVSDSRSLTTEFFNTLDEAVKRACELSQRHGADKWDWADYPDEYSIWGGESSPAIYEVPSKEDFYRIGGSHVEYKTHGDREIPVFIPDWFEDEDDLDD